MAIRIHHTQQKQADKLGIALTKSDMDVTASKDGQAASAPSAGLAISALLKKLGTTTTSVMASLKSKPKKAKRKVGKSKSKFKCAECGSTKRESDGEDGGGFVCSGCGDDAAMDGDDDGKSVIKKKYRTAYRPHKMTCGDALSQQIRAEFMTVKDPDSNKKRLDWKRFTAFAKRNDCWSDGYAKLNAGMRRMNVVNRLRARIAAGTEVVWGT